MNNYDVFIVGHAAQDQVRKEMVLWLKAHYPGIRILALNPPNIIELAGADYNVKLNGPETWLPVVATALHGPHQSGLSSIPLSGWIVDIGIRRLLKPRLGTRVKLNENRPQRTPGVAVSGLSVLAC